MDVYNEESEILAENTFTSTGGWTLNGQLLCCRNTYCAILCIKECLVDVDKLLRILATLSIVYGNCHDMEFVTLYVKAGTLSLEGLGKLFRRRIVHRLVSSDR